MKNMHLRSIEGRKPFVTSGRIGRWCQRRAFWIALLKLEKYFPSVKDLFFIQEGNIILEKEFFSRWSVRNERKSLAKMPMSLFGVNVFFAY